MDNTVLMTIILFVLGSFSFDLTALIILVIIGLVIIVLIKLFLVLIPAILVAAVVWFLTGGNLFWTGIAFLVVAALSILAKL
jgi:hypothetical protein